MGTPQSKQKQKPTEIARKGKSEENDADVSQLVNSEESDADVSQLAMIAARGICSALGTAPLIGPVATLCGQFLDYAKTLAERASDILDAGQRAIDVAEFLKTFEEAYKELEPGAQERVKSEVTQLEGHLKEMIDKVKNFEAKSDLRKWYTLAKRGKTFYSLDEKIRKSLQSVNEVFKQMRDKSLLQRTRELIERNAKIEDLVSQQLKILMELLDRKEYTEGQYRLEKALMALTSDQDADLLDAAKRGGAGVDDAKSVADYDTKIDAREKKRKTKIEAEEKQIENAQNWIETEIQKNEKRASWRKQYAWENKQALKWSKYWEAERETLFKSWKSSLGEEEAVIKTWGGFKVAFDNVKVKRSRVADSEFRSSPGERREGAKRKK